VTDGREFCCLITTDAELARLNRTFLEKDHATDVLSFPSGAMEGPLGDIAISADRASEQAREYGHSLEEEIAILMLHGVLHLLGMDHERDRGRMARTERQLRKDLDLPSGVIERVQA
jgi:probable rRNA maturation factor